MFCVGKNRDASLRAGPTAAPPQLSLRPAMGTFGRPNAVFAPMYILRTYSLLSLSGGPGS